MDKKITKILFSIDKNVNPTEGIKAAVSIAKKCQSSLVYIQTDASCVLFGANEDEERRNFKLKYFVEITVKKISQPLWKGLSLEAIQSKAEIIVVSAPHTSKSLLNSGMSGVIEGFSCPVLYLNSNSIWYEPKIMLMPLDGRSETRQKFYTTAYWASKYFSQVKILGLSNPKDKEDQKIVHTYTLQGKLYMEERKVRVSFEEQQISDRATLILEKANLEQNKWVSLVSNGEGMLTKSVFQRTCEEATFPILISPYQEVVGSGAVGY